MIYIRLLFIWVIYTDHYTILKVVTLNLKKKVQVKLLLDSSELKIGNYCFQYEL